MYSIVFRGVPHESFYNNLKEIRTWYQDEIILSTWNDVNIDNKIQSLLNKIIKDQDPGEDTNIGNPSLRYATRQILAARNGINATNNDMVLLSRTDIRHPKNMFPLIIKNSSISQYKVFTGKLVVGSIMSIDPFSDLGPKKERLFRICDWFQYGYKEDLVNFTNVITELNEYKSSGCCLEQLWFLCCFNKLNTGFKIDINNVEQYQNICWNVILENFRIINNQGLNTSKWWNKTNEPIYIDEQKYLSHLHNYERQINA